MKKIFFTIISLVLFVNLLSGCTNSSNVDTSVNSGKDYKIAAASVVATTILDKFNFDIVGRPTTALQIPERYADVKEIGMATAPNFEVIVSLGANLLIADATFKSKITESANNYNIETFFLDTSTYENFLESIKALGEKLNKNSEAKTIYDDLQKPLNEIKEKYKDVKPLKVAVIFGSSNSNMLATSYSYIGGLVKTVGSENITDILASENKSPYIDLSLEQILLQNPDVVLRFAHGDLEQSKINFDNVFKQNPVYNSLAAVKDGRVYDLDPTYFGVSANLHSGDAIQQLGNILYGKE